MFEKYIFVFCIKLKWEKNVIEIGVMCFFVVVVSLLICIICRIVFKEIKFVDLMY